MQPTLHSLYAWLARRQDSRAALEDFVVEQPTTEPAGPKARLLIDVSTTYHMTSVTGIQRTVRSLSAALQRNSHRYNLEALPVCLKRTPDEKLVLVAIPGFPDTSEQEVIALRPGDCFFMLDSSWDIYPKWAEALFPRIRDLGGKVFTCVYDILPITNPEYFPKITVRMFEPWFEIALRESDALLAISQATRAEILQAAHHPIPRIESFPLGADSVPLQISSPRNDMAKPTFLMVGTIEPRKGHDTVLQAFEMLWATNPDLRLKFVGRKGWRVSALLSRIRRVQSSNKAFVYHENASDELLGRCYEEADAVIAASLAEGFGLPLVETMQRGKQLIASDIPAFREIAGSCPIYFRPGDPASLAQAVKFFLEHGAQTGAAAPRWVSWDESADQLMTKIERLNGVSGDQAREI